MHVQRPGGPVVGGRDAESTAGILREWFFNELSVAHAAAKGRRIAAFYESYVTTTGEGDRAPLETGRRGYAGRVQQCLPCGFDFHASDLGFMS